MGIESSRSLYLLHSVELDLLNCVLSLLLGLVHLKRWKENSGVQPELRLGEEYGVWECSYVGEYVANVECTVCDECATRVECASI